MPIRSEGPGPVCQAESARKPLGLQAEGFVIMDPSTFPRAQLQLENRPLII